MPTPKNPDTPARLRATRACKLLARVVATGWFDRAELARELVMTPELLDAYLDGRAPIPLERQLCLALFVIERVPSLVRFGHQLRGQVAAALSFHERKRERPQWSNEKDDEHWQRIIPAPGPATDPGAPSA